MERVLDSLRFGVFEFVLVPERTIVFPPFKGNVFRGALGRALKELTCAFKGKPCKECLIRDKCLYAQLFESHNVAGKSILKNIEKAPHPFIIFVPDQYHLEYPEDKKIRFFLTLIGSAMEYISYFILAFEQIGKKGIGKTRSPFRVERVMVADKNIYDPQEKKVLKDYPGLHAGDFNGAGSDFVGDRLKVSLESPLRLQSGGRIQQRITFEMLVRNLLRRLHMLSAFYCDGPDFVDFSDLIEQSKRVETVDCKAHWQQQMRYSYRQEKNVSLGGISGWFQYAGDLKPFMPFLKLGEYLHLGKGTGFGLGKIRLVY